VPTLVSCLPGPFQFLPDRFDGDFIVEQWEHRQQSRFIERSERFPVRHFQKEMTGMARSAQLKAKPVPRSSPEARTK